MSNQNVDPLPGSLRTSIAPPISSTSCLLIARPSPLPPAAALNDVYFSEDIDDLLVDAGVAAACNRAHRFFPGRINDAGEP